MGKFIAGDIVVIPFPYTDLSQYKKRPALIIKELDANDYLLVMITSKAYNSSYSLEIKNPDFLYGDLPVNSFVRCNRIFEANESIILKRAATLSSSFTQKVIARLIDFLQH